MHLLRATQQVHYQLSQMADQKASILMGATFVTFTIMVGEARDGGMPPLPMLILGGFAFVAAVLAVLAVLPSTRASDKRPLNLLFFGSFVRFAEKGYIEKIVAVSRDDNDVCRAMATDIYQNGRVLAAKKYRLLSYAYRVFLVGLSASLIAFVVRIAVR
jgi:hypothetical protein